jgi:competence protein ComEA
MKNKPTKWAKCSVLLVTLLCVCGWLYAAGDKVDINHATKEELMSLKYVGETIAQRIIEYRNKVEGFRSLEQLLKVKGFGAKALEANKDRIIVTPPKKKGN